MSFLPRRRCVAAFSAALLALGVVIAVPAAAATRVPSTPSGLPSALESLAPYAADTSCDPITKPGTAKLAHLLLGTYPATHASTVYDCGTDGTRSEHYDGRAIDWMVSVRDATQRAEATAVISWLLATDRRGNKFANARRLGVMYVIFNNRIWGSWNGAWAPYHNCASLPQRSNDNWCHRTHIHISLSWAGAMGSTSFWTKRVAATDYGPCRARDMNWASNRTRVNSQRCAAYPAVVAASTASATKKALVTYSGAGLHLGSHGPAVVAVQRALHITQTGTYGSATRAAVAAFQLRHHVSGTGIMTLNTWRALLAAVR